MRLFLELSRLAFRRHMTYRIAAVAGLVTNFFFGLVRAYILLALYGNQQVVEGFTLQGVVTYTALTQAVIAYLSIFGWYDLMQSVYRGDVASDMLKPMNLFSFYLAQDAGRAAANLLLRGVTIMGLYAVFLELSLPASWGALALTLVLAWLLSFAWRFLINLASFWSPDARGFGRFGFIATMFFSGFFMPLAFFPPWVQRIAYLTPFPHMLNTVVEVYLGVVTGAALVGALLLQLAWALALILLCQAVLQRAVRRLVILGG